MGFGNGVIMGLYDHVMLIDPFIHPILLGEIPSNPRIFLSPHSLQMDPMVALLSFSLSRCCVACHCESDRCSHGDDVLIIYWKSLELGSTWLDLFSDSTYPLLEQYLQFRTFLSQRKNMWKEYPYFAQSRCWTTTCAFLALLRHC